MTVATFDRPHVEQKSTPVLGFFLRFLSANWNWGRLTVVLPDGSQHQLNGKHAGHAAVLSIHNHRLASRVLKNGDIGFAEGYMAGEWDSPDLPVLLETIVNNYDHIRRLFDGHPLMTWVNRIDHWLNRNSRSGSRRNIHAHYDLGNRFYQAWLDPSMTYSAARFDASAQSLEQAQKQKYAALARMMDLRPGHRVLEIGCGWGGFAEYAARECGATVTGVTISKEQHDYAQRRLYEAGLAERTDIRLVDYRDLDGQYDRVASIEMFEAVGREYWPTYFNKVRQVLKPSGRAGLQIITIQDELFDEYEARTDFIQKYVFPGGSLPSEARLVPVLAQAGLKQTHIERFGLDYAQTLAEWARRFEGAWTSIHTANPSFDERFRRLWRFYLAYCEAGFRSGRTDVVQMVLSTD